MEYRSDDHAIDFKEVKRFSPGYVIFRSGERSVRGQMQLDYGLRFQFWPASLDKWDDGDPVSESERLNLTEDLMEWANESVSTIALMGPLPDGL